MYGDNAKKFILLNEFSFTFCVMWFHETNNHDYQTHSAMAI